MKSMSRNDDELDIFEASCKTRKIIVHLLNSEHSSYQEATQSLILFTGILYFPPVRVFDLFITQGVKGLVW